MCGKIPPHPLIFIRGYGGIGRRARFRILCSFVQVQVLLPVPYRVFITKLSFVRTLDTFLSLSFLNIVLFASRFSAHFSFYPAIAW